METPSSSDNDEEGELIGNAEEPREFAKEGEGDFKHPNEMTWNSGGHGASPTEKQVNAEEVSVSQDAKNHS